MAKRTTTRKSPHQATLMFQALQEKLGALILETEPGERLPSEPDLAEMFGVSRATLREAMIAFEGKGVIRRRQGIGTFVISHNLVMNTGLEYLESIETISAKADIKVSMGELMVEEISASDDEIKQLNVSENDPLVKISRVKGS